MSTKVRLIVKNFLLQHQLNSEIVQIHQDYELY